MAAAVAAAAGVSYAVTKIIIKAAKTPPEEIVSSTSIALAISGPVTQLVLEINGIEVSGELINIPGGPWSPSGSGASGSSSPGKITYKGDDQFLFKKNSIKIKTDAGHTNAYPRAFSNIFTKIRRVEIQG